MNLLTINEGLIICNSSVKQLILNNDKQSDGFINHTFISKDDFIKRLFFNASKKALFLLVKKFNLKPQIAKTYLKSMIFLEDIVYHDEKLEQLLLMKRYLDSEGTLKYDRLFINILKNNPVSIVGLEIDKELNKAISLVSQYTRVEIVSLPELVTNYQVYKFINVNEETLFVVNKIKELLLKGIKLKNIKLCNIDDSYLFPLRRICDFNNLRIKVVKPNGVLSSKSAKSFLSCMLKYDNYKDVLQHSWKNKYLSNKFIDIINSYEAFDSKPESFISIMRYEMERLSYEDDIYDNELEICRLEDNVFSDEDYVFVLGFNQKIPRQFKNEDFLNDSLRNILKISNSQDLNSHSKQEVIKRLSIIKNLTISYSLSSTFDKFLPSILVKELKMKEVALDISLGLTKSEDQLIISSRLDDFYKYNQKSTLIDDYYETQMGYKSFNHQFKGISQETYDSLRSPIIKLSYSSLKQYYSCAFSYYLERILRIDEFEDTLQARLGTFAHAILMDSYQESFDFVTSKELHGVTSTNKKEQFYYEVMSEVVSKLIDFNTHHEEKSLLTKALCEERVDVLFDEGKLVFTGIIDKLKYSEINGEVVVAIIDYKTGNDYVSLDNLADGMNLQLPVYLYLLKKSSIFDNPTVAGFFLQHLNAGNFKRSDKSTKFEQLYESFRLEGYVLADHRLLGFIDSNYKIGDYLKNVKINKDDSFSKSSKILTTDNQDDLYALVDSLIKKAYADICQARFTINPKRLEGKNYSCTYCPFKDVCFMEYSDGIDLNKTSFLGGEEDVD